MGKANPETSVPGAPAVSTGTAVLTGTAPDTAAAGAANSTDQAGPGVEAAVDPRDAEIAALRAQLAAKNAPAGPELIIEGTGPSIRKHMAESKHLGITSTELAAKHAEAWKRGKGVDILGGEHHVLCKDGWFVNPAANARESQN